MKHHRQAEAESARSRSVGGSSSSRPTAVTQPVGTKSVRGPKQVGQSVKPRVNAAGDGGRHTSLKPKPKHPVGRKIRPEHMRVAGETEDEGLQDENDEEAEGAGDDDEDFEDEDEGRK